LLNSCSYSQADRDALYVIESTYSACAQAADVGLRQLQTRVAKGRTVAKFPNRVNALLSTLDRDFDRGIRVRGIALTTQAWERTRRQTMLREQVLTAAGRLYLQQLAIIEFGVMNAFRRELARLVAQELTPDARREQEQLALRKALFSFRAQAGELEDPDLAFVLPESRVAEVTTALETVLKEFPESSLAKLEEVRKVERLAKSGKGKDHRLLCSDGAQYCYVSEQLWVFVFSASTAAFTSCCSAAPIYTAFVSFQCLRHH
jgi:hypothetical protein